MADELHTLTYDGVADANLASSQGVAFDGTNYYTTAGSSADASVNTHLRKWTRSGDTYTLVTDRDTSGDWPAGMAQINSISVYGGYLWVGGNNYNTTPKSGWVLKFDPSDLSHVATYSVGANWTEGGCWLDVGDGDEFWAIFHDTSAVRRYDNTFTLVDSYDCEYRTGVTANLYQGLAVIPGTKQCIGMVHEGASPLVADVYLFTRSGPYPVCQITPPTSECTQGVAFDPTDATHLLWAERYHGGSPTQDHRIVDSTLTTADLDLPLSLGEYPTLNTSSSQYTSLLAAYPMRPSDDTVMADALGNYDGTFGANAAYDRVALDLPGGAGDYVAISSALLGSAKSQFTLTGWFKIEATTAAQILVSGNKAGSNAGDWQISTLSGNHLRFFYNNGTSLDTTDTAVWTQNVWFFAAFVLDTGGARIRIDGTTVKSNATGGTLGGNGQEIRVGMQSDGSGMLNGKVYDLRFYDAALSDEQIDAILADPLDLWTTATTTRNYILGGGVF